MVCAKFSDGQWYRAMITKMIGGNMMFVEYIDYGNTDKVSRKDVMAFDPSLKEFPIILVKSCLNGVEGVHPNSKWDENYLLPFTPLNIKVMGVAKERVYIDVFHPENGQSIVQKLINDMVLLRSSKAGTCPCDT